RCGTGWRFHSNAFTHSRIFAFFSCLSLPAFAEARACLAFLPLWASPLLPASRLSASRSSHRQERAHTHSALQTTATVTESLHQITTAQAVPLQQGYEPKRGGALFAAAPVQRSHVASQSPLSRA